MRKTDFRITILATIILMTACQDHNRIAVGSSSGSLASATTGLAGANSLTDSWVGRWNGVEGTYLDLSISGHEYVVKISGLDGTNIYEGLAAGDHIEFKRGGKTESIRATDGEGTGMKWLAQEKNCLVINVGSEGYCKK